VRTHDRAIALYDPAKHRPLATRFGQDDRVAVLSDRSLALWMLGYPDAALADSEHALKDAREIGQAAALMFALLHASMTHIYCGNYSAANAEADEAVALADEKGALFWKARSTGSTAWMPRYLSNLARAYAELGQFDDAWRCVGEATTAIETTKERWSEAEVHHTAGEIAFMATEPDAAKAEAHFDRALAVARKQ
jgi:predicted ATPase